MYLFFFKREIETECKQGTAEREGDIESEEGPGPKLSAQGPMLINREIMTQAEVRCLTK